MKTKAFQAYSPHGNTTAATPYDAALAHFRNFPRARKCTVTEGETDGRFFTVTYGRASAGEWPRRWKDVTRKTLLPSSSDPANPRPLPAGGMAP